MRATAKAKWQIVGALRIEPVWVLKSASGRGLPDANKSISGAPFGITVPAMGISASGLARAEMDRRVETQQFVDDAWRKGGSGAASPAIRDCAIG